MNKKRTNYLITILNILAVISFYLFYFGSNYLMASMFHEGDSAECIYGSQVIDFLLINIKKIILIFNISIAIFNIICAIQNRKNKKLCFWYFTFGIIEISSAIDIEFYLNTIFDINEIMFTGIPIILVIKNCILIKRNKPSKLEIISYIFAVIIAIVEIFEYINPGNCWLIVSIIMQFIYNHNQENNVNENNIKKFINIILYYIMQTLIVGSFSFMIIYSLIFTKVNNTRFDNEILQLFNNITTLKNSKNQEIYVPVEKNINMDL